MRISLLIITCAYVFSPIAIGTPCSDNGECPPGYYCEKLCGDCDGVGNCRPMPEICIDLWAPVLGCDGQTYSNTCYAARAGVNVSFGGECPPPPCQDNNDCDPGYYCQKAEGDCDGIGTPAPMPGGCPDVWDPICGCDGQTYSNKCFAEMAGVNVAYPGQCVPGPVTLMMEPKTVSDDVHTGKTGVNRLKVLWSEEIIFTPGDISVVNENNAAVGFTVLGSGTEIMTIEFSTALIHDNYTVTVADSTTSVATGVPIDGDDNGIAGGNAVILIKHRKREDVTNDNRISIEDLAIIAEAWLWEK